VEHYLDQQTEFQGGTDMKVGIVGCGQVAPMHIRALRRYGKVDLIGLCDIDVARAQALADRVGVPNVYDDLGVFLREKRPDVIHITTPPDTHAMLAIQALEGGSHVLVEKPMSLSVSEADEMIVAAQENGAKLCVDHNYLFRPSVQKAKSLLSAGEVGQVIYVDAYYSVGEAGSYGGGEKHSHWAWRLPGGVFTNFLPHLIYLQTAFLGHVDSVAGIAAVGDSSASNEHALDVSFLLQGVNGLGVNTISMRIQPYAKFMDIYGTRGIIHIDLANELCTIHRERGGGRRLSKILFPLEESAQLAFETASNTAKVLAKKLRSYPGLRHLITDFYESIWQDREPPVPGEEGREVVSVLEMARAKAKAQGIRSLQ
jgi:predicted dehydrogenase